MPRTGPPETLMFRRRIDGLSYCFYLTGPRNGAPSWKCENLNLWLARSERLGWAVVDVEDSVLSLTWALPSGKQDELPPEGEWVSKQGDKAYVYDLAF